MRNFKVGDTITFIPHGIEYLSMPKGGTYTRVIEKLTRGDNNEGPYIWFKGGGAYWPNQIKILNKSDKFKSLYQKLL